MQRRLQAGIPSGSVRVCVVLFILGESVIIFYMMRTLGAKVKIGHCALYSFVGFFFSCITPSASGGQPMQIYFMKKDKLPIPVTTLVLMIVTITYKAVLVVIGIAIWLLGRGFLEGYLGQYMWVFYLGGVARLEKGALPGGESALLYGKISESNLQR